MIKNRILKTLLLFIAILAAGALVGLARLGLQPLRAAAKARAEKARASVSIPVRRAAYSLEAVTAETLAGTGGAYASA